MDSTNSSVGKNINETLYNWATGTGSNFLKKVFQEEIEEEIDIQLQSMFNINQNSSTEKNRLRAVRCLYKKLWGNYPEFGPQPLIELLKKFEQSSTFYERYRDHTAHPLYVCFLGLHIYDKNSIVKNSFSNFIKSNFSVTDPQKAEDLFIHLWLLSSLYHDIGYLLENDKVSNEQSNNLKDFIDSINKLLKNPLASTPYFENIIQEESENKGIKELKIKPKMITNIENILRDKKIRCFELLKDASTESHLAASKDNGIKEYYSETRDHGICSAILLIYIWYSYKSYINIVCSHNDVLEYFPNDVINIDKKLQSFDNKIIDIAAQAISLHNIDKDKKLRATNNKLTIHLFEIALKQMPLAFLLRLCDELQDWDRPRPNVIDSYIDKDLNSQDLNITVKDEGVFLRFFTDEGSFIHPTCDKSNYFRINGILKKCLNNEDLTSLLHYETYTIVSYEGYILRLFHDEIQQNNDKDPQNCKLHLLGDLLSKGRYETFPEPETKKDKPDTNNKTEKYEQDIEERKKELEEVKSETLETKGRLTELKV